MTRNELEGGAFVTSVFQLHHDHREGWSEGVVVDREHGARGLSQYHVRLEAEVNAARRFPGSDCVVFVRSGTGTLTIGSRHFEVGPEMGAYVAPGETLTAQSASVESLDLLITVCPQCENPQWIEDGTSSFDEKHPLRIISREGQDRQATGDRFFQLLVDTRVGSEQITQFMGGIPHSKAPEHFHDYEEVICVLWGNGRLWTGEQSASVGPGSLIYIPRKQPHCLECDDDEGMLLVGHFYPAGSPAVRYGE